MVDYEARAQERVAEARIEIGVNFLCNTRTDKCWEVLDRTHAIKALKKYLSLDEDTANKAYDIYKEYKW